MVASLPGHPQQREFYRRPRRHQAAMLTKAATSMFTLVKTLSRYGKARSNYVTSLRGEFGEQHPRLLDLPIGVVQRRTVAPRQRGAHKGAAKAKAMAGEQIDRMVDPATSPEERLTRKRRLLKGPSEFRDMRTDLPKRKV